MSGSEAHVCRDCGGPCLTYKGSEHGWRCGGCVQRYLEVGAARGEAKALKARQKLLRATLTGERRDGGQAMCRDVPTLAGGA